MAVKTWVDMVPKYRVAGVEQECPVTDKRTVAGPASYVQGTGIVVDLSAVFATLHGVTVLRVFTTAGEAALPKDVKVHQAGTDTFANRKFRLLFFQQHDPAAVSGNVQGLAAGVTADAGTPPTLTAAASAATGADPDAGVGGPAVVDAAHTHVVNLSKIPEHQHAVSMAKADFPEVAAAVVLSGVTVEYEATGTV